ncbi:MAG: hypothetical protein R2701_04080 [Acidimicrobiales bacterium]
MADVDRTKLAHQLEAERTEFADARPRSRRLAEQAAPHLVGGVPMTWMAKWAGGFPLYLAEAHGSRVTDADDRTYVDFALGDTGAMAGHSPAATVAAVRRQVEQVGGITAMLPTEDAAWVATELAPLRDGALVVRRSRPPTPTAGPCAWVAWSPAAPRSR